MLIAYFPYVFFQFSWQGRDGKIIFDAHGEKLTDKNVS